MRPVVVAVPACNERDLVPGCLAALARQRDGAGSPLPDGAFDVLLLVNNSDDDTAAEAERRAGALPFVLHVAEVALPPGLSHAGGARRAAMDRAADRLEAAGARDGVILTTDADSRVSPTWLAANLDAFAHGADAVAGFVEPDADEFLDLGPAFGRRGRAEDRYLALVAEINARLDPRPHDPWPNHRTASGASLGVTLAAYRSIGGLPLRALGEDAALAHALECGGFRIRHTMEAVVTTSCRFDGRATGGAADTMRARHAEPEAPCDPDLEPARAVLRRAALKGLLRHLHATGALLPPESWATRLRLPLTAAVALAEQHGNHSFAVLWDALASSPVLGYAAPLRPADLPREIGRAQRIVAMLRGRAARVTRPAAQADRPAPAAAREPSTVPPWRR